MTKIVAVTASNAGEAHTQMAAEALKRTAQALGHELVAEAQGSSVATTLHPDDIQQADVVIVGADGAVERDRFHNKPVYAVSTSEAIRNTEMVIQSAVALVGHTPSLGPIKTTPHPHDPLPEDAPGAAARTASASVSAPANKFFVGITSCPTGIAHTFMAAEALKQGAAKLGHDIKVETQGSVGSQNTLTDEDIARADAVIIAADTHVDLSRFGGKRLYETSTKAAIHSGSDVVTAAMDAPVVGGDGSGSGDYLDEVKRAKAERSESRSGPYKHLLTGVSYMLPVIVAGGLIIALSFVFGINPEEGTFGAALMQIGGGAAFALIVPVLSGFIAFSIADRPGLAPGLIGGMLAANLNMGFLGGILSGFLAGYVAKFVRDKVNLPANFEGLKPVLVIPLLATLIVGLLLVYVFGGPVRFIMEGLTTYLEGLSGTNAVLLGLILGAMMAVDMGGPVNKAAYTFAVGLLATNLYAPMAAVMAAGMTPPLGLALATFISKKHFNQAEQEAGKVASVLGISFITEGAIPFAANDPLRILPACIAGSAVTGALSMAFGCTLRAPHGGVFVLAIPNAVENVGLYIVAIAVGTLITALATVQLKHWFPKKKAIAAA
ncbi:PTS fructose transporter subunit EIIBC [filamentous cyanobacterium CCT1]|nr:PTS fructose transporter subunit EIIBC [filamentous cyanobacterium CCT1]PSN79633.1 PTS fructose transporter subunit EIIBC [filamentous cyanobacterium CCP4]